MRLTSVSSCRRYPWTRSWADILAIFGKGVFQFCLVRWARVSRWVGDADEDRASGRELSHWKCRVD